MTFQQVAAFAHAISPCRHLRPKIPRLCLRAWLRILKNWQRGSFAVIRGASAAHLTPPAGDRGCSVATEGALPPPGAAGRPAPRLTPRGCRAARCGAWERVRMSLGTRGHGLVCLGSDGGQSSRGAWSSVFALWCRYRLAVPARVRSDEPPSTCACPRHSVAAGLRACRPP